MKINKLIREMFEEKVLELFGSEKESLNSSEDWGYRLKEEIITDLVSMIGKNLNTQGSLKEEGLYVQIYNSNNIWINAICNVFEKYNISLEKLTVV